MLARHKPTTCVCLQILQLEMERLSLAKAVSDRASKQRLEALDSQLKKLKAEQVRGYALSPLFFNFCLFLITLCQQRGL